MAKAQYQEAEPKVIQIDWEDSLMGSIGNSVNSGNTSKSLVKKACIVLSAQHLKDMREKDKALKLAQDKLVAITLDEQNQVAKLEQLAVDMKLALEKENEEKIEEERN